MQQQTRNYKSPQEFQKDMQRMARSGWIVANQSSYQPRRGCMELLFKPFAMLRPPKSIIMVTYQMAPPQPMPPMPPPYQQGMPPMPPYQGGYDPNRRY